MARPRATKRTTPTVGSLLGEWVRRARQEQGLSQRALADQSGLSRSYVCDIERGRGVEPSLTTLDKLAAALGASRADLMRAAGLIDRALEPRESEGERRLLSVFRGLSDEGQLNIIRFARFLHQEEHAWTQASFVAENGVEDNAALPSKPDPRMPALFNLDD